jgi:hypothetical protein
VGVDRHRGYRSVSAWRGRSVLADQCEAKAGCSVPHPAEPAETERAGDTSGATNNSTGTRSTCNARSTCRPAVESPDRATANQHPARTAGQSWTRAPAVVPTGPAARLGSPRRFQARLSRIARPRPLSA